MADSVGEAPIESLRQDIDEVYEFLTQDLIPHARAEDRILYPAASRVMGASGATAMMSRDHVEVERLTQELGALRPHLSGVTLGDPQAKELRRVWYGLHTLVKVHFDKEEEVYLPLLDAHLTAEEARQLFEAMEEAEQEVN